MTDSLSNFSSTLILDSGVQTTRISYSGHLKPTVIIPTLTSKDSLGLSLKKQIKDTHGNVSIVENTHHEMRNNNQNDEDAMNIDSDENHIKNLEKNEKIPLYSPLSDFGHILDWDQIEKLWKYGLQVDLNVNDFSDKCIFITEAPMAPKPQRELLTRFVFDVLGAKSCFISNQAILDIYSSGKMSGTVFDIGFKSTKIVPIIEGHAFNFASDIVNLGGFHVTLHLQDLLKKKYSNKTSIFNEYNVNRIKHKFAFTYCSLWEQNHSEVKYQLPDNSTIQLDDHLRKTCSEILFSPNNYYPKIENTGITHNLNRVIGSCDSASRKDLYANVILTGGGSMLPYINERIRQELDELAPAATVVGVVSQKERKYGTYVGGAILSSLSTFPNLCYTRQEYDEWGSSGIHKKCYS